MGKCSMTYGELRFVIEAELTHVYVLIRAEGDCPLNVQGWHYKAFPASVSIADLLNRAFAGGDDPVLWPLSAPDLREH